MSLSLQKLIDDYQNFDAYLIQFGENPASYSNPMNKFVTLAKIASQRKMLSQDESKMVDFSKFNEFANSSNSLEEIRKKYTTACSTEPVAAYVVSGEPLVASAVSAENSVLESLKDHFHREDFIASCITMAFNRIMAMKASYYMKDENIDKVYEFLEKGFNYSRENIAELKNLSLI